MVTPVYPPGRGVEVDPFVQVDSRTSGVAACEGVRHHFVVMRKVRWACLQLQVQQVLLLRLVAACVVVFQQPGPVAENGLAYHGRRVAGWQVERSWVAFAC